jgi:hypothetical protein
LVTLLVITGLVPAIQDFGDADLFRMREKRWDGGVPGRG